MLVHIYNENMRSIFCMNVGRTGVSWRTTSSSLSVSRTCQQREDEQQEERDQGFLTDSPTDKADGPADVSHNVLETVIL